MTSIRIPRFVRGFRDRLIERALCRVTIGEPSLEELRFLGQLAASLEGEGPIIEIGTLFGRSTMVLALNKSPGRRLVTVDNFGWNPVGLSPEAHNRVARHLLADAFEGFDTELVRADKADFYAKYDGPAPALVFLDAIHSYEETHEDLAWALRVGARVVCGHDYRDKHPGVMRAVDERGGPERLVGSLWVISPVAGAPPGPSPAGDGT